MYKLKFLSASILLFLPLILLSQDSLYPVESSGERLTANIDLQYLNRTKSTRILSFYDIEQLFINSSINGAAWSFKKKFNYLGAASGSGYYNYHGETNSSHKTSEFHGTVYGSIDYYLKPGKLYFNGSYALGYVYRFQKFEYYNSTISQASNKSISTDNNIWLSAGYGRIVNSARTVKLDNFEKILMTGKINDKPLSSGVKNKLLRLIEMRNNRDYQAKYKDNDEIRFFGDIEKLLLDEGIISKPLGAALVMELYQSLTNNKFIFYPKFRGLQSQIEIQYNPIDTTSINDFITVSSVYGFNIKNRSDCLISGFFSIPLRKNADDYGMFVNYIRNPFSNVIPVIAENYGMDIYQREFYGDNWGTLGYENLNYLGGLKFHLFHSFTNTIGGYLWGQGIVVKPKETGYRNSLRIGMQVDLNLISIIYFSAGISYLRDNTGFHQINSGLSTKIILF